MRTQDEYFDEIDNAKTRVDLENVLKKIEEELNEEKIESSMPLDVMGETNQFNTSEVSQDVGVNQSNSKVLTLSNGHSILANDLTNGGFASKFVMALMIAFACGAAASALYIFMNLGSTVVSL